MIIWLPFCVGLTWFTFVGRHISPPILTLVTESCSSTQYAPNILTPSILSRAQRRTFQAYVYKRSPDIWPTRPALLAYERALELEAQVEGLLDNSLTPARARSRSVESSASVTREAASREGGVVKESQRVHDARQVLAIFEVAYAEWKALGESNGDPRPHGLERFDQGMSSSTVIHTLPQSGACGLLDRSCPHTHCAEGRRSSRHFERVRS